MLKTCEEGIAISCLKKDLSLIVKGQLINEQENISILHFYPNVALGQVNPEVAFDTINATQP